MSATDRQPDSIKPPYSAEPAATGAEVTHSGSSGVSSSPHRKFNWSRLWRGLLVTMLLCGAEIWAEGTKLGAELNRMTYLFVQRKLEGADHEVQAPVVIVDISGLEPEPWKEGDRWYHATPRPALREMIQAAADAGAVGIGVDIDFSLREGRLVHPDDVSFFAFCQNLSHKKKIPIRLGVYRMQAAEPKNWFGSEQFSELGATIAIPDLVTIPRRLPRWVRSPGSDQRLPGLSAALVIGRAHLIQDSFPWWSYLLRETQVVPVGNGMEAAEFLVNLHWLRRLRSERISTSKGAGIEALRDRCRGRFVLLGDATRGASSDTFVVPGVEEPIAGALLHACGVATLHGRPLYELTGLAQWIFDIGLAVVAVLVVEAIVIRGKVPENNSEFVENAFTGAAAIVLILAGYVFVRTTRLVWDGFFFVALSVVINSVVDRSYVKACKGLRDWWYKHAYASNPK